MQAIRAAFAFAVALGIAAADAAPLTGEAVRTWIVPDTPGGLHSNQNWHAIASTSGGDIVVAGMDHVSNSALFRIAAGSDELEFIGDARSASEAAGNWMPGETAQKFHTRPTSLGNRMTYVATLDYSAIDNGHLKRRGFHWYGFATGGSGPLIDLSAKAPGGTAIEHGGLATLATDAKRSVLWGATIPDARIVRYNPRDNVTTDFGRPPAFGEGYSYTGRYLWAAKDGKVYFTGGNPAWGQKEPPDVFGHVHFFDLAAGEFGERPDWKLVEARAIEMGQWNADRTRCYLADDLGRVYRFEEDGPGWTQLGSLEHDGRWVWVMQLSSDERSIYFVNSGAERDALYEFDTKMGTTRRLAFLEDLHPDLKGRTRHTGHDAWDAEGRFYFTSFPWPAETDLLLTRVDPVRLKVAAGILPELVKADVKRASFWRDGFTVSRSGSTIDELELVVFLTVFGSQIQHEGTVTRALRISAGESARTFSYDDLGVPGDAKGVMFEVIKDRRDYVTGDRHLAFFGDISIEGR